MIQKIKIYRLIISFAVFTAAFLISLSTGTPVVSPPLDPTIEAAEIEHDPLTVTDAAKEPISYLPTHQSIVKTSLNSRNITTSPFNEKIVDGQIVSGNQRYPLRTYKALLSPNDPSASQWWVTHTGLPVAWDYGSGNDVTIAIIDSGFALEHEEFSGRWLENAKESGSSVTQSASDLNCADRGLAIAASCNNIDDDQDGINDNETGPAALQNPSRLNCTDRGLAINKTCNLIDDDNNGFIDDWRGWDFESGDQNVQAGEINPTGAGVSHGTSVAGTAAANGNNGVGMAGVNWQAKILPLQALSDDGSGNTLSVARAIRYAADNKADIINLSLGSDMSDEYLRTAILYALEKGSIVIAAAGNDGCECMSWPARYPEVLAVGAFGSDGLPASFSSYGSNLDILAPGTAMYLPVWSSAKPTNAYRSGLAGTSFATPYVSGLLASAKAKQPAASWGQLVNNLLQTSDHKTLTATAPRSNTLGFGAVRADSLMARASNPAHSVIRYSFSTNLTNTLEATTVSQCEPGQFPTAPFYEVRKDNSVYYSISELTVLQARDNGGTVTQKGYTCIGLPTDQVQFLRMIDPRREFSNVDWKQ